MGEFREPGDFPLEIESVISMRKTSPQNSMFEKRMDRGNYSRPNGRFGDLTPQELPQEFAAVTTSFYDIGDIGRPRPAADGLSSTSKDDVREC